jgi:hypothetical protein
MDGIGDHHVEQDNPSSKSQILQGFAHACNEMVISPKMVMVMIVIIRYERKRRIL